MNAPFKYDDAAIMKAGFRGLSTLSHMMRISWHKTAIKQGKNGCKKAENTVIKIISDRTVSSSANQPKTKVIYAKYYKDRRYAYKIDCVCFWERFLHVFMGKTNTKLEFLYIAASALKIWLA